ncbi:AMP-dependent synthetase/ligase [Urechidicola vernalis]|uniref:Long-chain fatty acid--CoA ligase n=1 Tax=Urechidicola vernalis TaxID=3075600 RepID=A0ABU2Y111_9FLAO|nr:long-chain fatty acid--CoA ligase [Urechidicola sp. P050]MDT0551868.1 long-chain fatty acid--CoA ligase [Urechidicola sp. P050]
MQVTRLFDFPYYQLENNPLPDALVSKVDGEWTPTSTIEYINQANAISRALLKMGVKPGDKIAIISSSNRTEWNIMDIGVLQIGAQTIPIYPTSSKENYEYIFNHSESTYCFLSDQELYDKANAVIGNCDTLKEIYSFEEIEGCKNWKEVLEDGADESNQNEVEKRKEAVKETDLATIIYTSGTTGTPKGVMLSHKNIVSNTLDSTPRLPLKGDDTKVLSFLPLCHVFERVLIYIYQYNSLSIYYAESIEKMPENIKEVKPNFMSVVPRLLEKIYDKIIAKGADLTGIKKMLFFWAVNVGEQYKPYNANGWWYEKKLAIAKKLIFVKWREALGGEINTMVSGSAALQPRLTRIFTAAGMHIMEGYGLTETSPVISVNQYEGGLFKIGTVGKAIDNVEVKIAEDGEILIKGPNVMMGYYKNDEMTASVMTGDYFHTGDKGELCEDGFLKITGRKKEIFKTSGGKYISPVLIENVVKQSRFIEQIMVVGEGEKMAAAIVQPNFEFCQEWAKRHEIEIGETTEEISVHVKVIERINEEIEEANKGFGKWETIKKFELTPDVWTIDNNCLTPTLKPKRAVIKEKYMDLYNKIYSNS